MLGIFSYESRWILMIYKKINDKKIYIVDNHQEVLPIWTKYFLKNDVSLELVTLDYHADSIRGFNDYSYKIARKTHEFNDLVGKAGEYQNEIIKFLKKNLSLSLIDEYTIHLDCDEHILAALELGVINKYQIVYCMDQHFEYGGEHLKLKSNYCEGMYNPDNYCRCNCPQEEFEYCHNRLEDKYLKAIGLKIPLARYILDIDLDYFQMGFSLEPINYNIFKKLVTNAEFITIARSDKYFNELKLDDKLNVDYVQNKLLKLISLCLQGA
jgi:hypothetical protein